MIRRSGRLWAWAVLALLAGGGTVLVACTVPGELWGMPALLRQVEHEKERQRVLEARGAEVTRSMTEQDELLEEVAAGRLALREAAARLRALLAEEPGFQPEAFRIAYPGATEDESYCRAVIDHVGCLLGERPEQGRVVGRLQAELRRELECGPIYFDNTGSRAEPSSPAAVE
jgi:hypothetical protein